MISESRRNSRGRILLLFGLALLAGCAIRQPLRPTLCETPVGATSVVDALKDSDTRLVWPIAHRGERNEGADNSRESILASARYGVPLIEIDIRFSADGTPFLFHDRHFRSSNYEGPAELLGLAPGELNDVQLRSVRLPGGSPLLFFSDALMLIRDYKTALELDIKGESPANIDRLVAIADRTNQRHQLVIQCQKPETLKDIRLRYPDLAVVARLFKPEQLDSLLALEPQLVLSDEENLPEEVIEEIHRNGAKVCVKVMGPNVDSVERWERLFRRGADTLMTDHGNKMMFFIRKRLCSAATTSEDPSSAER